MKTLKQILELENWLPICDPKKKIRRVEGIYLPHEIEASEASCNRCNGVRGYYIPHGQEWWCLNCLKLSNDNWKNEIKEIPKIPEKIIYKVPSCNQSKEVIDFMQNFSKEPKGFIVLSGKNGTGKTFLVEATLHDCKLNNFEVKFITQSELNQIWNDTIKEWGSASYYLKLLQDFDVLAIDDLGTRTPTEAFMDALYFLIESRHRNNKGTIITTNQTALQIREKYGDAFLSRIASGKNFRFEGPDRRIKSF